MCRSEREAEDLGDHGEGQHRPRQTAAGYGGPAEGEEAGGLSDWG
jgi:hypothetical protein